MRSAAAACAWIVACRAAEPAEDVTTVTVPPAPIVTGAPATDAGEHPCAIALGDVLAANTYRGTHETPARRAMIDHLDPRTRMQWDSMDHGVVHLLCKYAVRMNGSAYTYEHVAGQNVTQSTPLEPAQCSAPATLRAVVDEIRSSTHDCTEPHAGAYWGHDLEPVE